MPTFVLGINDGHNGTACLLKDGRILACASEERFIRKKNYTGFPTSAVEYCLSMAGIKSRELAKVVIATKRMAWHPQLWDPFGFGIYGAISAVTEKLSAFGVLRPGLEFAHRAAGPVAYARTGMRRLEFAAKRLDLHTDDIELLDHHTAHAYAALFSSPFPSNEEDALVLTNDGLGDWLCATVSVYRDGLLRRLSETFFTNSLGSFYERVTLHMGMKSYEDEYKIMGMAGYVRDSKNIEAYRRISGTFKVMSDLTFRSSVPLYRYQAYIAKKFQRIRFDSIAAAVQSVTEELLVQWTRAAMRKAGIGKIAAGGGTFMNVKANMKIAQLPEVKSLFVMPSCGDESNAIGAAYWGYLSVNPSVKVHPLRELYLGPSYSNGEVASLLESRKNSDWSYEYLPEIEEVIGEIIAKGRIVARLGGRMEFGARALGNRSILADPTRPWVARELNQSIKSRDFWMPFAPSIPRGFENDYIKSPSPSKTNDQYMMFAYESTEKARSDLVAAMHPYDETLRPQVVEPDWNPSYSKIIEEFASRTGRHGILNTSFNLHGQPIVNSPLDAITTFENSGLQYLALENYLVSKSNR